MKKQQAIDQRNNPPAQADPESGWALMGVLLALSVMSIMLLSIAPNVKFQVQRDKEAEMLYRGQQMAEAIARYYNNGRLGPVTTMLRNPPPYGYLTDLKKLREGILIGVNEVKFVRSSSMIDSMVSEEWEPIRARDPRILPVLQAYALETGISLPPEYLLIAAPPPALVDPDSDDDVDDSGEPETRKGRGGQGGQGSGQPGGAVGTPPNRDEEEDDEDEDDEDDEDEDDEDEDDEGRG